MDAEPLLNYEPSELNFPVELNKQLSCSIRLLNRADNDVAFKLLSTNPRRYVVRPRIGILSPRATCDVTVTRRAPLREVPHSMRSRDKFMIRIAVATPGATLEDAPRMFDRDAAHGFHEWTLRVVYSTPAESSNGTSVTESPGSHVPEGTDSGTEPRGNDLEAMDSVVVPQRNDLLATNSATEPHCNLQSTRKLLNIQPSELQFPFITVSLCTEATELPCSIQLSNVAECHVAFRVKNASPKFLIQPNVGVLLPQSKCDITVRKQVESNVRYDIQNEDKLLVQSVVAPAAAITDNTIMDMFDKEEFSIEECELPVIYISEQENNIIHDGELILRGIISGLLVLIPLYLMKRILSWIWSLTVVAIKLMIKAVKKVVSDSLEEWVVNALVYMFMHVLFGRRKDTSDQPLIGLSLIP